MQLLKGELIPQEYNALLDSLRIKSRFYLFWSSDNNEGWGYDLKFSNILITECQKAINLINSVINTLTWLIIAYEWIESKEEWKFHIRC